MAFGVVKVRYSPLSLTCVTSFDPPSNPMKQLTIKEHAQDHLVSYGIRAQVTPTPVSITPHSSAIEREGNYICA